VRDQAFFDRVAPLYDLAMPRADPGDLATGLALADRPVERVLDVGGGTGRAARELPDAVVVDASPGMLSRARERGLECVRGDAARLPVRDASVDAVLIVDALHHFPAVRDALAEAARVLRPGGALVVREFDPDTLRGRGVALAERLAGFGSRFFTPDELAAAVSEAGLAASVPARGFGYTVVGVHEPGEP
jgi:demethylmenaquinone methyltransferase/2-methoxy-6-polyprenyl-1,4-benzoquinol methylase